MILGHEFLNMYPALACAHSKKKKGAFFMCFQIDVSDSCVTQMFLHSCVTQILTEHVHDARFCDLEQVDDTLTLLFWIFSCGSMLMFLNNRDKYLTF